MWSLILVASKLDCLHKCILCGHHEAINNKHVMFDCLLTVGTTFVSNNCAVNLECVLDLMLSACHLYKRCGGNFGRTQTQF